MTNRPRLSFARQYLLVVLAALAPVVLASFVATAEVHALRDQVALHDAAPRHMT